MMLVIGVGIVIMVMVWIYNFGGEPNVACAELYFAVWWVMCINQPLLPLAAEY